MAALSPTLQALQRALDELLGPAGAAAEAVELADSKRAASDVINVFVSDIDDTETGEGREREGEGLGRKAETGREGEG